MRSPRSPVRCRRSLKQLVVHFMSHFVRFALPSIGQGYRATEVCIRKPNAMHRHVLISFYFSVFFHLVAHAQAGVDTTAMGSVPTPILQEPTLQDALRQVAKGNRPHKGRMLANWVGRKVGRCLHLSMN